MVSVEDFIGYFEDLVEAYQRRIIDLKQVASACSGNEKTYRKVKRAQAEELEQCVIEMNEIIAWFYKHKRNREIVEKKVNPRQLSFFTQECE